MLPHFGRLGRRAVDRSVARALSVICCLRFALVLENGVSLMPDMG